MIEIVSVETKREPIQIQHRGMVTGLPNISEITITFVTDENLFTGELEELKQVIGLRLLDLNEGITMKELIEAFPEKFL